MKSQTQVKKRNLVKISEEDENSREEPLKQRISRLVYKISANLPTSDIKKQADANSALLLLNHAMMVAEADTGLAARLLNRARTIARG